MPPEIRLRQIEKIFTTNLRRKWWKGVDLHSADDDDNIEKMTPLQILYELRDELTDSVAYLETAIDKLEKNEKTTPTKE